MMEDDRLGKGVQVGISVQKDTTISFSTPTEISELYISGRAFLKDESHGFIRVTLKDNYNSDYLIYEVYPILADSTIMRLQKIGMETKVLDKLSPQSIRIEVSDATFQLDSVYYVKNTSKSSKSYTTRFAQTQDEQCQYIVDRLNDNLARRHMLWRAGMTSVAKRTYEEKKDMFGGKVPNLKGFEYYVGGVFSTLEQKKSTGQSRNNSSYVKEWDWRNRHGKDWITPVKNQEECGSCWAFATVGALEAYVNLYYNHILNYNLSEQDLVTCDTLYNEGCNGGLPALAYKYVKSVGVVGENCFPYLAFDADETYKCDYPSEIISIQDCDSIDNPTENQLKSRLIHQPLSIDIGSWDHSVTLVGFKEMALGDSVWYAYGHLDPVTDPDDVGETAWLIKNSWGEDWGMGGYGYLKLAMYHYIGGYQEIDNFCAITGQIQSLQLDDNDIKVTDSDGDGYYFWGIGPKPSHCPSWVPNTPDGDDSDYSKGPMDAYGFLQETSDLLNDTIFITSNTKWNQQRFLYSHVVVKSNATLTVTDSVTFYQDVTMTLEGGGKLNLNGGHLLNAVVKTNTNNASAVTISNNGTIELRQNDAFSLPLGNTMQINCGIIK